MSQTLPSEPQTMLPDQRSPWMRAGGSVGTGEIVDATHRGLDRRGLVDGQRLTVDGSAYVGHDPARGEELRPGRQRAVGQGSEPDEAVLGAAERSAPAWWVAARARPNRSATSVVGLPGSIQSSTRQSSATASTLGTWAPSASRSQRSPSASRSKKPSGGCGRVLMMAPRPSVSRSRVDVQMSPPATGRGGDDTEAKECLRPCGGSCHACHDHDVTPWRTVAFSGP